MFSVNAHLKDITQTTYEGGSKYLHLDGFRSINQRPPSFVCITNLCHMRKRTGPLLGDVAGHKYNKHWCVAFSWRVSYLYNEVVLASWLKNEDRHYWGLFVFNSCCNNKIYYHSQLKVTRWHSPLLLDNTSSLNTSTWENLHANGAYDVISLSCSDVTIHKFWSLNWVWSLHNNFCL